MTRVHRLRSFADELKNQFPEARLDLTKPASNSAEVVKRLDTVVEAYADIVGCRQAIDAQESYIQYTDTIATHLSLEPTKLRAQVEVGIAVASLLLSASAAHASVASDILTDASMHGANAVANAPDVATHGGDVMGHLSDVAAHGAGVAGHVVDGATHAIAVAEGHATWGVSVILSLAVGFVFSQINKAKKADVEGLSEKALLKARLAKTLMTPGRIGMTADVLERLAICNRGAEGR